MFLCAFRPGEPLGRADLFGHTALVRGRIGAEPSTLIDGCFAAVAADASRSYRPLVARWRHLVGVGDVRLDNRRDIASLANTSVSGSITDLEVVLRAIDARGEKVIPELLGDFGFVVWDARACKVLAIRDAFGVKPLFYRTQNGLTLFASRMDALATSDEYDLDHIADVLVGLFAPRDRTIWTGVRPVPAGGYLLQRGSVREGRRFWSPDWFRPENDAAEAELAARFSELLREGVATRMATPATTWSQLSGGLDSSSVVSIAQSMLGPGETLGGTITVVDTLGNGDERKYSDVVVRRFGLRNEQVRDYWAWQDDGMGVPDTDGPRPLLPFYARDRRLCDVIRNSGGRVVLSGFGADHYLRGHLHYIGDLAGRGRVKDALRETLHWSVSSRQSFWSLLREHVVSPFMPRRPGREAAMPAWIRPAFVAGWELDARMPDTLARHDRPGEWFARRVSRDVQSIPAWTERWPFGDDVEIRYPFLYRPLVEASLRMPPHMRIRPGGHKWILREAMRGILPEEVRRRGSKGTIDVRVAWSLERERHCIEELLRDPVLAQLGCIDPYALRMAVDAARHGREKNLVFLMNALSLETWLSVRAGRFSAVAPAAATAA